MNTANAVDNPDKTCHYLRICFNELYTVIELILLSTTILFNLIQRYNNFQNIK